MRLQDRVAVVTGGAGGIGSGICLALARDGADIVVSDIDVEAAERCASQVRELGRESLVVQADVTVAQECLDLVEAGLTAFGKIDILVNNAGLFGRRIGMPFTNQEEEDWDNCYRVNVKGPFLLSKAVAPHMMERRYGKIINISSIAARRDAQILPDYTAAQERRAESDPGHGQGPGFLQCQRERDLPGDDLVPVLAPVGPHDRRAPRFRRRGSSADVRAMGQERHSHAAGADPRGHRSPGGLPGLRRGPQYHRPDHLRGRRRGHGIMAPPVWLRRVLLQLHRWKWQ